MTQPNSTSQDSVYVHPDARCESTAVGRGTRVWAFAHIMKGAQIGDQCNVGGHAFIESGALIGDRVTIKNQVMIWDGIEIESDAFIGPGVIFTNDQHPRSPRMRDAPSVAHRYAKPENWLKRTRVCRGASLGAGAIILPGVTVGTYSMIGAGSVVTVDVPPHARVAGNPARLLGWVCICGQPATAAANTEPFLCPDCAATPGAG